MSPPASLPPASAAGSPFRRARPYLFRAGWALADQGLSTATNFALIVLVARRTDPAGFGFFVLALAVFTLVQGTVRAAFGESLLVLDGAATARDVRRTTVAAVPIALAIAASGVLLTAPAWVGADPAPGVIGAFAMTAGGLLLADLARYGYFAMRRPDQAAGVDAVWAVLMVGGVLFLEPRDATSMVLVWGGAGTVAGVIPFLSWRIRPRLVDARRWWSRSRSLAVPFGTEFLAGSGAGHLSLVLVGALASVPAAGAVRAAMLLFGPINVAFQALTPQAIVEGLGVARRGRRFAAAVTIVFLVGVAAWTLVLVVLPDGIGRALLGSNWTGARDVVPAYVGYAAAGAIAAGAFVGLRVRRAARASLRARLISAGGTLTGAAVGAYLGGAVGAAAGMGAGGILGALVWWRALLAESPPNGERTSRAEAAP